MDMVIQPSEYKVWDDE